MYFVSHLTRITRENNSYFGKTLQFCPLKVNVNHEKKTRKCSHLFQLLKLLLKKKKTKKSFVWGTIPKRFGFGHYIHFNTTFVLNIRSQIFRTVTAELMELLFNVRFLYKIHFSGVWLKSKKPQIIHDAIFDSVLVVKPFSKWYSI